MVPCTEKQREANDLLEDDNNIPNTFPEKSTPSLYNTALIAFPNEEILENYRVRSQILEVFFPNMKLGLVKENNSMAQSRIKYFCNLLGIQLIFVPNAIVNNPKKLYRYVMIKAKK